MPIRSGGGHVAYCVRRLGSRVDGLPEEALLAGFAAGDPELAAAFVRRFQSKVFGIARRVVFDPRIAEDVAQSAFERAWRHARTYDPRRGSVGAWLGIITRNLAIDAVRVRPVVPLDVTELLVATKDDDGGVSLPERAALESESVAGLRAALRTLPAEQARAVVLAGIAGLSASQVAASEGIALGTAKTRIRSAMLKLRSILQEAGSGHA
jgi:RNA polymerase sigma factor (sigma-70 family)